MFSFCDVILHNKSIVRGAFLHSESDKVVYTFSRKPVELEGLETNGYVTKIPGHMIEHVRFFATVYLYERISALSLLTDDQKELIVKEMKRFMRQRELYGIENLLNKLTLSEMMILLTEVEHDRYIVTDGEIIRFVNDDAYPIHFHDPKCLAWLLSSYMDAAENLKQTLPNIEEELAEYRRIFYEMSYEEIDRMYSSQ
jgi:hypothetical protein